MPHRHTHNYTIIVPLETFEARFSGPESTWPRHITVVPGMHHVGSRSQMHSVIASVAAQFSSFDVSFGAQHMNYGERPAQDVVTGAEALRAIHATLIGELGKAGCTFFRDQFTVLKDGYTPHSSGETVLEGTFDVRTLLVIAKYLKDGNVVQGQPSLKEVEEKYRLGGSSG